MGIIKAIRIVLPNSKKTNNHLESIKLYSEPHEVKTIKKLLKKKEIQISYSKMGVSQEFPDIEFPQIEIRNQKIDKKEIDVLNKNIYDNVKRKLFRKFSKAASKIIPDYIAPNLYGYEDIKKAVSIQLFSEEAIHILLLGDPGTGKTDILNSAVKLSTISSFGLGSGTSGVGLSITVKGKNVKKGLLPLAHEGLCAIDELNLMKDKDYASLYNAMEKGFVTYDKGGKHYKFDARVNILATANPIGDQFKGLKLTEIKKQIPFESALLSRFNLIFLIRKPDVEQFKKIGHKIIKGTKKLNKNNSDFIREYIKICKEIKVELPQEFEKEIINISSEIKRREKEFLINVTPRLIIGLIRLVKASARMRMKSKVSEEDIKIVKEVFLSSLKF